VGKGRYLREGEMKNSILIFFSLGYSCCFAQDYSQLAFDTLNKLDAEGKKTGYWVELLNEKLMPEKKQEKAVFCWIAFYEKGVINFPTYSLGIKGKFTINASGNQLETGRITLMDGTYELISKGKISARLIFNKGHILTWTCYYENGTVARAQDFTKKWQNHILSHSFSQYESDGRVWTNGYLVFENGKWQYRAK